ncbi:MAG: divalent metal cation transporter [Anaerolineaceae bacterium]|nr:divalent metal cation transporter [Anaerolineaceae bacterium]
MQRASVKAFFAKYWKILLVFFSVFGPATITAFADNDASGVATYSIAGAKLGYPILFLLPYITILLGVTQEMGIRLAVVTRKGLGDLIRERWGVRISLIVFTGLLLANLATVVTEMAAIKAVGAQIGIPAVPIILVFILVAILFVTRGKYKHTQIIMLFACLFFLVYIFAAIKVKPDWQMALSNLIWPHGVDFTPEYWRNYLIIGLGVLGTTITPWGQFFISSFSFDKKIEAENVKYSQFESYWGAFLTDFFSFFMIVATAATLFYANIPLESAEEAAMAIKPFAGELAGTLFAIGILNAGFMGLVIVSLSTAYAFSEFFGTSGSLDYDFKTSKMFYLIFIGQLVVAGIIALIPAVNLFTLAVATQALNAMVLPLVFFFLLRLTSDPKLMRGKQNKPLQRNFTIACTAIILLASVGTLVMTFFPNI